MTKKVFSLLALALLFAACSNIDNTVLDTPTIPTVEGKQNIVEESEFSSYIDWQTYAGDDFYRYATGAWQDRTTLVGDERSKGILQEQSALADAYLKKVYKEGTMPQLSRIFQAYRSDDKAKIIRLIQDKLDNIDREVNTKEDAWKKMAALMKDGYYVPMDFTVWPLYRKVYAALIGNSSFGNTGMSDLEIFIPDDAEKLAMIKIANEYGRIANRDDMPKWGRENCTSDDDDIVLMGDEDDRSLTRSENFPETTPLGHEITHGFDTKGAMRDANGRQNSIISGNDQSEFDKRSNDMIAYFGSFTYGDGIPVDGKKTNRENIADQGGLHIAYDALMKCSGGQASERLYKAREYFRAYAYGWIEKGNEGYMEGYLNDVHSPGFIRATGNVFMADEFYEAFGITDGKQYITPKKRIHIW